MTRILILLVSALLFTACSKWDENRPQPASPDHGAETSEEHEAENDQASADVDLIPRTVIFGNADRTIARISPNGEYVSWLAPVKAS